MVAGTSGYWRDNHPTAKSFGVQAYLWGGRPSHTHQSWRLEGPRPRRLAVHRKTNGSQQSNENEKKRVASSRHTHTQITTTGIPHRLYLTAFSFLLQRWSVLVSIADIVGQKEEEELHCVACEEEGIE